MVKAHSDECRARRLNSMNNTVLRSALLAAACLGMGSGALAQMGGAPGGASTSGKNLTGLWERSRG